MATVILEFSLCLIENTMMFLFINSLLEKRFNSVFLPILAILTNSVAVYVCSDLNMFIKIPLTITFIFIESSVLFKNGAFVRFTYTLISLYTLYIIDIIFGNIFSMFFGKDIMELFYDEFVYRLITCLIIKVIDGLVFIVLNKMLYATDKNIRKKYWALFSGIMFAFLSIAMVFLQIYPGVEQNTANIFMYTILAVLFFAMSLIVIYFFTELSKGYQRDSKLILLESNFSTLQEQIAVQQQNSEKLKKFRHDMKNHLSNIRSLIDSGEIADAAAMLDKIADNAALTQAEKNINSGNNFVDAIILSKTALCKDKGIDFTYSVQPMQEINIDAVDLSSLLSNLLDNAIESAAKIPDSFVKITIFKYNAYYTICVENSYKGKKFLRESAGSLLSTKPDSALHGYGTHIISDIAAKYSGNFSWEAKEDKFVSTVLLKI